MHNHTLNMCFGVFFIAIMKAVIENFSNFYQIDQIFAIAVFHHWFGQLDKLVA